MRQWITFLNTDSEIKITFEVWFTIVNILDILMTDKKLF
jgi:hypothetical protein